MKLEDAPQDVLVCNRSQFSLTHYRRSSNEEKFRVENDYLIAVGLKGYKTPPGLYVINTKVKDPDWMVPDSPWAVEAGLKPGTIVPGGTPENPLKKRWLGITDPSEGVGIHGTASIDSLGTRASHGCIRMAPWEVVELYDEIPKGTIIFIL